MKVHKMLFRVQRSVSKLCGSLWIRQSALMCVLNTVSFSPLSDLHLLLGVAWDVEFNRGRWQMTPDASDVD